MKTQILKINYNNPEEDKIKLAAEVLKRGGTVVFPTETVYGLGANGLDEEAVKKIFIAKGRPSDNPIILHIADVNDLKSLTYEIPEVAKLVINKFCPGPLTIVFKKSETVSNIVTGGLDTIAVRMPNHNIALQLIKAAGVPVAAPSANISGSPSPTCAAHVIDDLNGKADVIIDGGSCAVGVESTVLDLTREVPTILRPGGVTLEQLRDILGEVQLDPSLLKKEDNIKAIAPGMKYTHYSPKGELIIVDGEIDNVIKKINELAQQYNLKDKRVGIIATEGTKTKYNIGQVLSLGDRENLEQIAGNLFTVLRQFDSIGVDIILCEAFENERMGLAIMNRLTKAAGYNVIKV